MKDIRQRSRDALRAELAEVAVTLFARHGFDEVTVDDVALAAGISRATFFRYFASKEDAVVAAVESTRIDFSSQIAARLAEEPAAGERGDVWAVMRACFARSGAGADLDPAATRARLRMLQSTPGLQGRLAASRGPQTARLAEVLGASFPDPITARVAASVAFAAYDLAWSIWRDDEARTFAPTLEEVFDRLEPAIGRR
ncbi:MAG: TetR family transcriptional regulator [Microbacterium sp.]